MSERLTNSAGVLKKCEPTSCMEFDCSCNLVSDALDKLAHYEDLEEQGRLIELPCKLGTNVYLLNTLGNKENWRVYKRKVSKFVYQQYRCKRIEVHFEEGRGYTLDGAFGDTVFLSRKEAEQALKRMKGE